MSAPMSFAVVERVCNREQTGDARRRVGSRTAGHDFASTSVFDALFFDFPGSRRPTLRARAAPGPARASQRPAAPRAARGVPAPRLAVAPAPATPGHTAFTFSSLKGPSSYQSRTRSHKTAGAAQQPLRRPHGVARTKSRVARRLATDKFTTLAQTAMPAQCASSPFAPLSDPPPAFGMAIRLRIDARATSSPPPHPSLRCADGRSARRPEQEITRHACPSAEL